MTLTINLPEETEAVLKTKAQAQGLSAEQYVQEVLERDLENSASPQVADPDSEADIQSGPRKHISEVIAEIMRDVSPEVMATMPTDGASEHDHYLYGWPKRNS